MNRMQSRNHKAGTFLCLALMIKIIYLMIELRYFNIVIKIFISYLKEDKTAISNFS